MAILRELCVDDFSEMAGKHIFVIGEVEGLSFMARGFRALRVDNSKLKSVIYKDFFKENK